MSDQLGTGTRAGRKPHPCAYCERTIPTGEVHVWWTIADAGTVWTGRAHPACERAWYRSEHYDPYDDELPDTHTFRTEVLGEVSQHERS